MNKKNNALIDVIRGMVIGIANIIPGVSGGTMMVSMGIYDQLIYSITHLFSDWKKSGDFTANRYRYCFSHSSSE